MALKNQGVVYNGLVANAGRRPSKRKFCTSQRITRRPITLRGGPMDGEVLYMIDASATLPFTYHGQTGRYLDGIWSNV